MHNNIYFWPIATFFLQQKLTNFHTFSSSHHQNKTKNHELYCTNRKTPHLIRVLAVLQLRTKNHDISMILNWDNVGRSMNFMHLLGRLVEFFFIFFIIKFFVSFDSVYIIYICLFYALSPITYAIFMVQFFICFNISFWRGIGY